jgi:hypothetical protein
MELGGAEGQRLHAHEEHRLEPLARHKQRGHQRDAGDRLQRRGCARDAGDVSHARFDVALDVRTGAQHLDQQGADDQR